MGFGKKRSKNVGVGAITTNKRKLFAEGGMMDDGKSVDPVSGNDVPVGSLAEEVRDDVDAKLSPGEFVIPADVVRFIGLERLMKLRDDAKRGLARMNDIGQMGNAEAVGEASDDSFEENDDFESEIDGIMKEVDQNEIGRQTEMAFNTGGFVNASYYDIEKAPKNPALDIRFFKDSEGKDFYMPFINGKPMKPMPNGAVQTSGPAPKTSTTGGGGDAGGAAAGAGVAGVIADTRDLTGSLKPNAPGSGGADTSSTATQQQQVSDSKNAGASSGISGVYTGSNLADFGKSDMIYNPAGSGAAGEVVTEDLWNSSISNADIKLGTTVLSTLASVMGVPGIVTLPLRLAVNKYGADAVNAYLGRLNQEMVGKAGGVDTSTPEGIASAASQIDQLTDKGSSKPAASSGAIGTGSIAAQASTAVADALIGIGLIDAANLSDEEIANLSQRAADAVMRGIDFNTAVNNAKTEAVESIYANLILNGEEVTKERVANAVFRGQLSAGQVNTSLQDFEPGSGENVDYFGTSGGRLAERDDFVYDEETPVAPFGDFWDTMEPSSEEEETEESGFFNSGPTSLVRNPFKKKETQRD